MTARGDKLACQLFSGAFIVLLDFTKVTINEINGYLIPRSLYEYARYIEVHHPIAKFKFFRKAAINRGPPTGYIVMLDLSKKKSEV